MGFAPACWRGRLLKRIEDGCNPVFIVFKEGNYFMKKKSQTKQSDWKNLVQVFVANMLERVGDNVSKRMHEFAGKLKKRTIGGILIFVGFIFFIIGVALFINAIFSNQFPWLGWTVSGLVVALAGYVVSKD